MIPSPSPCHSIHSRRLPLAPGKRFDHLQIQRQSLFTAFTILPNQSLRILQVVPFGTLTKVRTMAPFIRSVPGHSLAHMADRLVAVVSLFLPLFSFLFFFCFFFVLSQVLSIVVVGVVVNPCFPRMFATVLGALFPLLFPRTHSFAIQVQEII